MFLLRFSKKQPDAPEIRRIQACTRRFFQKKMSVAFFFGKKEGIYLKKNGARSGGIGRN
jgi:hypothetical protein